jgi:TonB family protein
VIHFDFDNRYQDEPVVGNALSPREGFVWSVVAHVVAGGLFLVVMSVAAAPPPPQEEETLLARVEPLDRTPIVFIDPRLLNPTAPRRPEIMERRPVAPPRPEAVEPPQPAERGAAPAPPARVESPAPEESRVEPAPPQPVADLLPRPESQVARTAPPERAPAKPPETRRPTRVLEGAIRNPTQYLNRDAFDNAQGADFDTSSSFQFDDKGIDFSSWLRRFKLQVTGNWIPFIPRSAMVNHGRVFLQFWVHKNGTISDVRVVLPSEFSEFTRVAEGAILSSNPTAPLPADYPDDRMLMRVGFFYNERPPDYGP